MAKKKNEEEVLSCPVGKFFRDLENLARKRSEFHTHLNHARVEFLKAIRLLVDERIEAIEKKSSAKNKKKMTRIEVQ
jgi:hypothetical protein